jgi:hypothetical protein
MVCSASLPIVALDHRRDQHIGRNPLLAPLPIAVDEKGIDRDDQLEPHQ